MEFGKLIEERHSVRKYEGTPVAREILDELVRKASLAPSSRNKKPCRFFVVTEKETLARLSEAKASGSAMLAEAGAAIVVAGDTRLSDVWVEDCSIAMTYLHLAAVDAGLGSCWVQLRKRQDSEGNDSGRKVAGVLGLEEGLEVLAVLSLGNVQS